MLELLTIVFHSERLVYRRNAKAPAIALQVAPTSIYLMNMKGTTPLKEYVGLYAITEDGKVWSSKRSIWLKLGTHKDGYRVVLLRQNKKYKYEYVHRLVAKTFIPNPLQLPQVNHKNFVPDDNRVENLEWCDSRFNTKHYWGSPQSNARRRTLPKVGYWKRYKKLRQYILDKKYLSKEELEKLETQ